jgi:hypothetical protein
LGIVGAGRRRAPGEEQGATHAEPDPRRGALGEQAQEQAEEAGNHGEVLGARPMTRGMLMCTRRRSSRGVMLRCVLSSASAYWRVTDRVQGPEGTVAE